MELPEDMEVSITITFRESSDYRFRPDTEATQLWSISSGYRRKLILGFLLLILR